MTDRQWNMNTREFLIERGATTVGVKVYFDARPTDPADHGWVAEYWVDGVLVTDSEKADHDPMPRNPDAEYGAVQLATAHARHLAAQLEHA